ncbi:hypothetical protein JXB01_00330, partial [Candidatus Micrarchaeota archaeon]|nr:hypothetical protein [Candidatus Micrarchaeota archaeon]
YEGKTADLKIDISGTISEKEIIKVFENLKIKRALADIYNYLTTDPSITGKLSLSFPPTPRSLEHTVQLMAAGLPFKEAVMAAMVYPMVPFEETDSVRDVISAAEQKINSIKP